VKSITDIASLGDWYLLAGDFGKFDAPNPAGRVNFLKRDFTGITEWFRRSLIGATARDAANGLQRNHSRMQPAFRPVLKVSLRVTGQQQRRKAII
jgi:hypothetical protein